MMDCTLQKKVLVIAPVMACASHSKELRAMLSFLESDYQITLLDPLEELSPLNNEDYYQWWRERLAPTLESYDVFIGFSFGAVILQQCFTLFENLEMLQKPILLFSAPAFADSCLTERLGKVITFAQDEELASAYELLMTQVLYPSVPDLGEIVFNDPQKGCQRLIEGLTRVITTDSRAILSSTSVEPYHFIGENSYLVNHNHIFMNNYEKLVIVPNAGMRVLQDNVIFCQQKIGEILL